MTYQWYPGHMTKSIRAMREQIGLIDLVIELIDARIPIASRNPDLAELAKGKFRILILNKTDLADPAETKKWRERFEAEGYGVLESDARKNQVVSALKPLIKTVCAEKIERDKKRGIVGRPIKAMICGIPNVGKSTLINSVAGKASAKTGNKPGVTRGTQWIHTNFGVELLDTPGILWPKFEDQIVGRNLALIGSMNDEIVDTGALACDLLDLLQETYPKAVEERYGIPCGADAHATLEEIGKRRGCLEKAGSVNTEKASGILLDDFRSGKLGRITLERTEL